MRTVVLLAVSNIFMTIAWYGHLKYREAPLVRVILVSWLIVFAAFSVLYLGEPLWNHAAGFACIVAAAFFIFHQW